MNVNLTLPSGTVHPVTPNGNECSAAIACPACGASPLRMLGQGRSIESRDTYRADAGALCCGALVGVLRVKVETIFGLEEDEAMLVHGRARVYG